MVGRTDRWKILIFTHAVPQMEKTINEADNDTEGHLFYAI